MNAATPPVITGSQRESATAGRTTAGRTTAGRRATAWIATARSRAARLATGRRAIAGPGAVLAAIGAAALTGCSAGAPPAPSPGHTATPTTAATATSLPTAIATPSTPPTTAPAAAVPVLGRLAGVFAQGQGFGQVKPTKIFNGGDPTGLVTNVTWSSWGGAQAIGSGRSDYVGSGQSVATGKQKPVTVVAFRLGKCHGTLMYRAVEWYFPKEGQAFNPGQYENICAGSYVPAP